MPDGNSNVAQPQKSNIGGLDDVREQARRLHGRQQVIDATNETGDLKKVGRFVQANHDFPSVTAQRGTIKNTSLAVGQNPALLRRADPLQPKRRHHPAAVPTASTSTAPSPPEFYPAYCHSSSPTYFQWVKLTAQQIHLYLTHQPGYLHSWITQQITRPGRDAPQLLFYKNHPIQFVQIVGVVVSIEEWFERFWLFTIDDGSGMTIDIVCRKPEKDRKTAWNKEELSDIEKEEQDEIQRLSAQVARDVQIGAILQVKGTVTLFQRNKQVDHAASIIGRVNGPQRSIPTKQELPTRQITLQRLTVVPDTNKEISLIAARTDFYNDVLCKPWMLTKKERERWHRAALGDVEHKRKKVRRQAKKKQKCEDDEAKDAEEIMRIYADEENSREEEAARVRIEGAKMSRKLIEERKADGYASGRVVGAAVHSTKSAAKAEGNAGLKQRAKRGSIGGAHKAPHTTSTPLSISCGHHDTTMSFGADDAEKSALLRAAFG